MSQPENQPAPTMNTRHNPDSESNTTMTRDNERAVFAAQMEHKQNPANTLTEQQEAERGALLAKVLNLRRDREHKDRWQTQWGTKTDLGLFRIAERIVKDGE